jgi:hypothetical protein
MYPGRPPGPSTCVQWTSHVTFHSCAKHDTPPLHVPHPGPLCLCAVDIVFARSKPLRSRRLGFREFLDALAILAQELRWSFDQVAAMLTSRCMGQGEANVQQVGRLLQGSQCGALWPVSCV